VRKEAGRLRPAQSSLRRLRKLVCVRTRYLEQRAHARVKNARFAHPTKNPHPRRVDKGVPKSMLRPANNSRVVPTRRRDP